MTEDSPAFSKTIDIHDDKTMEVIFAENLTTKQSKDFDSIRPITVQSLQEGFQYAFSVLGEDFPYLQRRRLVNLTQGEYARCRAQGQAMNLPIEFIRGLVDDPKSEQVIIKKSLIVHEIIHEITDDEDLPMFLEMIYAIEHGVISRISQIKSFLTEGKLDPPHIQGLKKIVGYLNYQSPEEMLDALPNLSLEALKNEFKKQVGNYCDQEFENPS